MVVKKNLMVAVAVALFILAGHGTAFALDSTTDLIAKLRANGFNDNEIAIYKSRHPELFAVSTTAAVKPTVAAVPTQTVKFNNNAVVMTSVRSNASLILAELQKRGYNLQELIAYMRQHPDIFPPNVDPVTKRMLTAAVANTTKVKPVAAGTSAAVVPVVVAAPQTSPQTSDATVLAALKARGFNDKEIALYKAQHPEQFAVASSTTVAQTSSLMTVDQLKQRGFNDAEVKYYYATHQ